MGFLGDFWRSWIFSILARLLAGACKLTDFENWACLTIFMSIGTFWSFIFWSKNHPKSSDIGREISFLSFLITLGCFWPKKNFFLFWVFSMLIILFIFHPLLLMHQSIIDTYFLRNAYHEHSFIIDHHFILLPRLHQFLHLLILLKLSYFLYSPRLHHINYIF